MYKNSGKCVSFANRKICLKCGDLVEMKTKWSLKKLMC